MTTIYYDETQAMADLLVGRRIVEASTSTDRYGNNLLTLTLDNGTKVTAEGNAGCGGCTSGGYWLSEWCRNTPDNIITSVGVDDSQAENAWGGVSGTYTLFVLYDDRRVNVAEFEGTDGNGYYGSGFSLTVTLPTEIEPQR